MVLQPEAHESLECLEEAPFLAVSLEVCRELLRLRLELLADFEVRDSSLLEDEGVLRILSLMRSCLEE